MCPLACRVPQLPLLLLVPVLVMASSSSSRRCNNYFTSAAFYYPTHYVPITTITPPQSQSLSVPPLPPPPPARSQSPPHPHDGCSRHARPSSRSRTRSSTRTRPLGADEEGRPAAAAAAPTPTGTSVSVEQGEPVTVTFRRRGRGDWERPRALNDAGDDGANVNVSADVEAAVAVARHAVLTVLAAALSIPPDVLSTAPMVEPTASGATDEGRRRMDASRALAVGWGPRRGVDDGGEIWDGDGDRRDGDDSACGDGFEIPVAEERLVGDAAAEAVNRNGGRRQARRRRQHGGHDPDPSTYGEITQVGARQLFHHMKLTDRHHGGEAGEAMIDFVDLGSGTGKLVTQAHMELDPRRLRSVLGVELSPTRHAAAVRALGSLPMLKLLPPRRSDDDGEHHGDDHDHLRRRREGGTTTPTLELINGDMFVDADLSRATHVYVASLCFTDGMMEALAAKLIREATPELRCVATLKKFPARFEDRLGVGGEQPGVGYVQVSWSMVRGCPVYFYSPPRRHR